VKKKILLAMAAIGAMVLIPATAMAATTVPGTTYIAGTITQSNHKTPIIGATVVVTCNSSALDSTTTAAGGYIVQFTSDQCPTGSTAGVAASKGPLGGSNSGTVDSLTTDINLALVNVSFVPELGLVTGIGATIIGGGAFLAIRRRELSGKKANITTRLDSLKTIAPLLVRTVVFFSNLYPVFRSDRFTDRWRGIIYKDHFGVYGGLGKSALFAAVAFIINGQTTGL